MFDPYSSDVRKVLKFSVVFADKLLKLYQKATKMGEFFDRRNSRNNFENFLITFFLAKFLVNVLLYCLLPKWCLYNDLREYTYIAISITSKKVSQYHS